MRALTNNVKTKILNYLGLETKEQKRNRVAFELFANANYNNIYNRALNFAKDDELLRNGLLLNEQQLQPRINNIINNAISDGIIHPSTFELCNELEM